MKKYEVEAKEIHVRTIVIWAPDDLDEDQVIIDALQGDDGIVSDYTEYDHTEDTKITKIS